MSIDYTVVHEYSQTHNLSYNELCVMVRAAVAAQPASPAPLTASVLDEIENFLTTQDALDNHELSGPNAEDYFAVLRRRNIARKHLDAALASPQIAPALADEQMVNALRYAMDKVNVSGSIRGEMVGHFCNRIKEMQVAAPVQVASHPIGYAVERSAFRVSPHGQDAESREWLEFTDDPKEKGAFPVWVAPVAPQDDARDAAEVWNEAIEATARRIESGSFLNDQSPAKLFANELAPVIRSMKRTPAAKPTEPT